MFRRLVTILIVLVVIGAAALVGVIWWLRGRDYVSTDDAFIDARGVTISPQVIGPIIAGGGDGQPAGRYRRPAGAARSGHYKAAVAQAEAQVAQADARSPISTPRSCPEGRIEQADKQVAQTEAALTFAQQENERFQDLLRRNAGTPQQAQQAPRTSARPKPISVPPRPMRRWRNADSGAANAARQRNGPARSGQAALTRRRSILIGPASWRRSRAARPKFRAAIGATPRSARC